MSGHWQALTKRGDRFVVYASRAYKGTRDAYIKKGRAYCGAEEISSQRDKIMALALSNNARHFALALYYAGKDIHNETITVLSLVNAAQAGLGCIAQDEAPRS